jgi:hypothetical protein
MQWVIVGAVVMTLVGWTFFALANAFTKRQHAKFGRIDVEAALEDVVTPGSRIVSWSLFLAWPIDDPFYESIRQECQKIDDRYAVMTDGRYMTDEGLHLVEDLLTKVRQRAERFSK